MRIKKLLLTLLIIFTGSVGLLFGCAQKPMELSIFLNDEVVTSVTLKLPNTNEGEDPEEPIEPEEPESPEPEDPEEPGIDPIEPEIDEVLHKCEVLIKVNNANSSLKEGLNVIESEKNIVNVKLLDKTEDEFLYEIEAQYPKNITLTFETKDGKSQAKLNVNIEQEVDKIEENTLLNNFVILGENKEINKNLITFIPNTTTEKNITFVLAEDYKGIEIINNRFVFNEGINAITLFGEKVNKIFINAIHSKFNPDMLEDLEDPLYVKNQDYIVKHIAFDVLEQVNTISAIDSLTNLNIENILFATNMSANELNMKEIVIKKTEIYEGVTTYSDLDENFEIKYYLENNNLDLVNIESNSINKHKLTISQKLKDGIDTLVVYVQHKTFNEFKSEKIKINIKVQTYPTYISVNGNKNPDEIILYDNLKPQELNIVVGQENSFNTKFKIRSYDKSNISLNFANGMEVPTDTPIASNTKLYLTALQGAINNTKFNIILDSEGNSNVSLTLSIRIVKSLTDVNFTYKNNSSETFNLAKINEFGNNNVAEIKISSSSNIYIPVYKVEVENENIVKLENINYNNKTFSLKALTSGTTEVKVTFDNGLVKNLVINVFTPVKEFKLDLDSESIKNNVGQILYEDGKLKSAALKINTNSKMVINGYDEKGNLISDSTYSNIIYNLEGNDNNIAVSNIDNTINAINCTPNGSNYPITITAIISAYNKDGKIIEHEISFKIEVYIPINGIVLSTEYLTLYTSESLGEYDQDLSNGSVEVIINPNIATKISSVRYQANFANNPTIKFNDSNNLSGALVDNYTLNILAENLDRNTTSTTGTITFSIQEYDIVYTRKVTVKISNAITPEDIYLDNVNVLSGGTSSVNYIYFNLGLTPDINVSPRVLPLNSYNTDYFVEIISISGEGDPIKFDKSTGVISAIKVGECNIKFIPYGSFKNEGDYKFKQVKVVVADGSEAYPYEINNKNDFFLLANKINENLETLSDDDLTRRKERLQKHYVLTSDLDLSNESFYPIGILKYKTQSYNETTVSIETFTGSFNGNFVIDNISKNYTISGINVTSDLGENYNLSSNIKGLYLGLFAKNNGEIKNLNVYYSSVNSEVSCITGVNSSVSNYNNQSASSFYFGGIAGENFNLIENCNVTIYNANITTYMQNNYIGLIAGENKGTKADKIAKIANCKVSGNVNILNGLTKYNVDNEKTEKDFVNILAGGIAGKNSNSYSQILDTFNIYSANTEVFNKDKISSTLNLTSIYNNDLLKLNENSAFGGVAGENHGTIGTEANGGVSSYGKISAYQNVGGMVGTNEGNIYSSFSASVLNAHTNVGGLIGYNKAGNIKNNAVMFLDDESEIVTLQPKIRGYNFVAGLIGKKDSVTLENNFVQSYVKRENYIDVVVLKDENLLEQNYGSLYSGLTDNIEGTNFANFTLKNAENEIKEFDGSVENIGITAPESLSVTIKESTLTLKNSSITYNKFIKANDNTIVLYYYEESKYNEYLQSYLFKINENYPNGVTKTLSLIKITSLNKDVLEIDDFGRIKVKSCGEAQIYIYSLLNKQANATINFKIINYIDNIKLYKDSLNKNEIYNNFDIEKNKSENLYLNNALKQDDVYLTYKISNLDVASINDGNNESKINSKNAQIIRGIDSGTVSVNVNAYVLLNNGDFTLLPLLKTFNVRVSEGLSVAKLNINNATLMLNTSFDMNLNIQTGLTNSTDIVIEQYCVENNNEIGEWLNYNIIKSADNTGLNYNFKITANKEFVNNLIDKTINFKIYITDDFVNLTSLKQAEEDAKNNNIALSNEYSKHIKNLEVKVVKNNLINIDLSYFADGELVRDELGNNVVNTNEYESSYIKIGRIGVLKINVYPIENLNSLTLTYYNEDNLNLNFKQVKKTVLGYEDVTTATLIYKGIRLDLNSNYIDDNYIYVKLLTDSPIKEGSVFNIKAIPNNETYYFEKNLTSLVANNLELNYKNTILNKYGQIEGIYAKGVKDNQIITVRASKLNGYPVKPLIKASNSNIPELKLISTNIISPDVTEYSFILDGVNTSGESIEISFYVDKVINGRTERYLTSTLKLNVVDFVVNSIDIEEVIDGYLSKPYGLSYDLKVKLNTINNGKSDVLNLIQNLEEEISKEATWFVDYNKIDELSVSEDFEIIKNNGYYSINAKKPFKGYLFSSNFAITYNNGVNFEVIDLQNSSKEIYMNSSEKYSVKFRKDFKIDIYLQADINHPVPVYNQEDFENMQPNGNYILLNDITLENYTPKTAEFNTLDGNGFKVILKSFNVDLSTTKETYNLGLFDIINENSLIKNLTIQFNLINQEDEFVQIENGYTTINLTNISNVYFGSLAGINNGLIYNCNVLPYKTSGRLDILNLNITNIINETQTFGYFGTMVGLNNGVITNSQSELCLRANKGFLSGFVATNNGTISSSYYKNATLANLGEDETTSSVAGFIHTNNGNIKYSYAEGDCSNIENGQYLATSLSGYDYCLSSPTSVGGFVYNNTGIIEDSYSNLSITSQSFSGGFVFTNTGEIKRCYSASKNEEVNSVAHAPFIATKVAINNEEMKKLITDCFYLNVNTSSINDELVKGLTLSQFNNEYYLTNFVIDAESGIWQLNENLTPSLIETNNIAESKRELYSAEENADGSITYSYAYKSYYFGHKNNPIIISNEEEFLSYFNVSSDKNTYYYRLINNINFSEYSNLPTINTIFGGRLDGNGLAITNISISAPSNFNKNNFGLFSSIEKLTNNSIVPVVKNLVIEPIEVYGNNVQRVGTLAGRVVNANIVNITINASNVIVQGKNIVGGVIGELIGDSKLINITSNISTNANFAYNNGTYIYDKDIYQENNLIESEFNKRVSYAGSVCGVVNTNKTNNNNERVRNIVVKEGVKSIGEFAGLAFGCVTQTSGVDYVLCYVNQFSYVNAGFAGGLVVGENRGYLSRIETKYSEEENQSLVLFKNKANAIGGIIGFNNNGTIVNSIANVSVITTNNNTLTAGGVIGFSIGGQISSVIATNNVDCNYVIGGIIGYTAGEETVNDNKNITYYICSKIEQNEELSNKDEISSNAINYIYNVVALNKYQDNSILQNKTVGAIIGAAFNDLSVTSSNVTFATKNSYIASNNYYKEIKYEKLSLFDFGASGCDKFDDLLGSYEKRENNSNSFASVIKFANDKETIFNRFSKSTFENINITSDKIKDGDNLNIPKLKSANNINTKNIEGEGTYANPYIINSVTSINQVAEIVNNGNNKVYVNLADNLDVTGKDFVSIGNDVNSFDGTFNGNNYFINGLTYTNKFNYQTQSQFGLFGIIGTNGAVGNLNISCNYVINYGSKVNYTGGIVGINRGYISNCNVYGGIVGVMQDINSGYALSYVGGISGVNAGLSGSGIVNCNNYATILNTVTDEGDDETVSLLTDINIYAGFISGANLNNSTINKSYNKAVENIALNKGSNKFTLIVVNKTNDNCNNYVGTVAGFNDSSAKIYYANEDETKIEDNIYTKAKNSIFLSK